MLAVAEVAEVDAEIVVDVDLFLLLCLLLLSTGSAKVEAMKSKANTKITLMMK